MQLVGRGFRAGSGYRYGFNGQERSTEIHENSFTAEYWEYDGRIGRRWNVDPVFKPFESPYATLGGNPILLIDPLGLDWYKNQKTGSVDWFKGSGRRKGYGKSLGATYDGYTNGSSGKHWMNGDANGKKTLWLDEVVVTGTRKKDNSLMERALQVSNVTQAERDAYNARPKPASYDANPLKTIFWDATIAPLLPIDDFDAYIAGNIKHKTEVNTLVSTPLGDRANPSLTVVWMGLQGGITSEDNRGLYGNLVSGDVSYLSMKFGAKGNETEIRGLPFRNLGVSLSNSGAIYGDYSPELRVLQDTRLRLYGVPLQAEVGMGWKQPTKIGLRGKIESPSFLGWKAEAVGGLRVSLKWPEIIKVFF